MLKHFNFIVFAIIGLFLFSCSTEAAREGMNKVGDVTGQVVGEISSGVAKGVEKSLEPEVVVSEAIKSKGITTGKVVIGSDSAGTDNVFTIYLIFNNDFSGDLTAKAFDAKGREMGRIRSSISAAKDEARYVDFTFDRRTNIDHDSKIVLE